MLILSYFVQLSRKTVCLKYYTRMSVKNLQSNWDLGIFVSTIELKPWGSVLRQRFGQPYCIGTTHIAVTVRLQVLFRLLDFICFHPWAKEKKVTWYFANWEFEWRFQKIGRSSFRLINTITCNNTENWKMLAHYDGQRCLNLMTIITLAKYDPELLTQVIFPSPITWEAWTSNSGLGVSLTTVFTNQIYDYLCLVLICQENQSLGVVPESMLYRLYRAALVCIDQQNSILALLKLLKGNKYTFDLIYWF